uniref:Reverse transcriptase Ty1/copia-type domain-containing protein n=1 Tax=Nicotiana tabacum TaxID=4097 RepID=A0A1S4AAT8_TOBAC|nr:PREDICTED: uncharacterized protein LOC107795559 [Nicotiana tabacum]
MGGQDNEINPSPSNEGDVGSQNQSFSREQISELVNIIKHVQVGNTGNARSKSNANVVAAHNREKFAPRVQACAFLGYSQHQKGYRLLELKTKTVFVSRDVKSYENHFPFVTTPTSQSYQVFPPTAPLPDNTIPNYIFSSPSYPSSSPSPWPIPNNIAPPDTNPITLPSPRSLDFSSPSPNYNSPGPLLPIVPNLRTSSTPVSNSTSLLPAPSSSITIPIPPLPIRKSERISQQPSYLNDYVCNNIFLSDITSSYFNHASHPIALSFGALSLNNQNILRSVCSVSEPHSYAQAFQDVGWRQAMEAELAALELNNIWDVVNLPQGKKALPCKWVYKVKHKLDGYVERLKARLVVRGDIQRKGINYSETFSPVVKMTTIRCLLTVAVKKGWNVSQLDVNNAFSHGVIGRGNDMAEIDHITHFLNSEFKVKNLGDIHYFLGIKIIREPQGFIINQRKFTLELLEEFGCSGVAVSSPLDPSSKLHAELMAPLDDIILYHRCYLHSDPAQGILLFANHSLDLIALCDAEWAACKDYCRSITWLVRLLADLSAPPTLPVTIHSDSQAAIYIARNPVFHERTKHVELDCHFVRQQYLSGLITLSFVPSKLPLADLFTKHLTGVSHNQILPKLGVFSPSSNLKGDVKMKRHINLKEDEM